MADQQPAIGADVTAMMPPVGADVTHLMSPPAAPRGSERTRVDTNAVGVDHDKIVQGIANWASTLRPSLQKPAAILATFPVDALASLVEMFSAPESIATAGAKPVLGAMDATATKVGQVRAATAPFAETLITKKLGMDPEAIQLQAARLRLQAARSKTRQGLLAEEIANAQKAASARRESVVGGTQPLAGPPAAAAPASTPPPGPPAAALSKANLSAPEVLELDRLRAAGKTEQQAYAALRAAREIRERFGLKIPTKAETRFPKGNRGGPPTDE